MEVHIDKNSALHYAVCFLLAFCFGWYGACAAAGAAVTKEWCDKIYGSHWCWMDILFDAIGIAVGIGLHFLIF